MPGRGALVLGAIALISFSAARGQAQSQVVDSGFDVSVTRPAFPPGRGPVVTVDEGHRNFHTAGGQYEPFARLLANDGYRIAVNRRSFTRRTLAGLRILVIANALGGADEATARRPAFSEAECDAISDWVRGGGALLLIADHSPFGSAAKTLAARFGVDMGEGWVFVADGDGIRTQIVYSRDNGRLGDHPILEGRSPAERIDTIRAFTGQSLSLPAGATALMRLPAGAREAPDQAALDASAPPGAREAHSAAVDGRVQGLAMPYGRGRVVILAEAAMLSAQIITLPNADGTQRVIRAGMNAAGYDNRQFALNLLHWLSGLLP